MKYLKIPVLILLFCGVVFSQSGPKMEIEQGESINTGSHQRGKQVIYEIKFKNTGDSDLKITGV